MRTDRRKFIKASALSGLAASLPATLLASETIPGAHASGTARADVYANRVHTIGNNGRLVLPTHPQVEWQDSEFGVLFHFDISVAAGVIRSDNSMRETFDPQRYNPSKLDTDQWIRLVKEAGATYAIFTATHFGGFLQWQSDLYPYGLKQAKWRNGKGDVVGDFIQSCYKYNIKPAIYLSTHRNVYWKAWGHYVDWGKGKGTAKQKEFNRICEKMSEELCARYGRLLHIWYDAGVKTPQEGGPDVLPIFERHQPHGIFYHSTKRSDFRWVGNEAGYADYPCWATMPGGLVSHNAEHWKPLLSKGTPDGGLWSPAMVDVPLRGANRVHSWFWHPDQEHGIYNQQQLMKIYEQSVGRNSNLVLGVVIDPDGLVPDADAQSLSDFGKAIQHHFGQSLASTRGEGEEFSISLGRPTSISRYILQEDIRFGERVLEYTISGQLPDGKWVDIDKGSCIGHKRIGQIDQEAGFKAVKLKVDKRKAPPFIRDFSVYA